MQGTRVKVLEELDAWASNANSSKVYWMVGMAGIGKSTIAHTLCENLEGKNILGGSFFASRASEKTRNARLIIPVIAHALARASPRIKVEVVKAIEDDPTLAEPNYININEQFKRLIYDPVRTTAGAVDKVVVIDAVDECDNLEVVASFIKLVLEWAPKIPFKIFLTSRDEYRIRNAFRSTGDSIREFISRITSPLSTAFNAFESVKARKRFRFRNPSPYCLKSDFSFPKWRKWVNWIGKWP
jgi:nucleoside-triphosphatase THEP1